jgi:hypothetical protein
MTSREEYKMWGINTLNTEINTICHLLALLEAHHILRVSRIRVKDRVQRRLFLPKAGKRQAEEENYAVRSLYRSLHIITATKSRRV